MSVYVDCDRRASDVVVERSPGSLSPRLWENKLSQTSPSHCRWSVMTKPQKLSLFTGRLSVFRGRWERLSRRSLTAFSASRYHCHMFDPSCFPGNQPSAAGMCLEVERGAARWPFVIWVIWDKAGCLGQVGGLGAEGWVYMRYCSLSEPLVLFLCSQTDMRWRGREVLDGVIEDRKDSRFRGKTWRDWRIFVCLVLSFLANVMIKPTKSQIH